MCLKGNKNDLKLRRSVISYPLEEAVERLKNIRVRGKQELLLKRSTKVGQAVFTQEQQAVSAECAVRAMCGSDSESVGRLSAVPHAVYAATASKNSSFSSILFSMFCTPLVVASSHSPLTAMAKPSAPAPLSMG